MATKAKMTRTEFGVLTGLRKQQIYNLTKEGRLVIDANGLVDVKKSLALMEATSHPAYPKRRKAQSPDPILSTDDSSVAVSFQKFRAIRERYGALAAKRDYEISMRELIPAEENARWVIGATTIFRSRLEGLPFLLAARLAAETDELRCEALLREAVNEYLDEIVLALEAGPKGG